MHRTTGSAASLRHRALSGAMAMLLLLGLTLLALAADGLVAMLATAAEVRANGDRHSVTGSHVAIYNLAGEVRVEPGTGRSVEVWVAPGGRDGDELSVETGPIRGRETLRVMYPGDRILYRANGSWSASIQVDDDGTFGEGTSVGRFMGSMRRVQISSRGSGLDAHADLRIAVPRGQRIDVHLGVGKAEVTNVDGTLRVDVASASVSCTRTRGSLTLDSGSGSLFVENAEGEVALDTGSGEVEVSNVRCGHLSVDTGSGSITGSNLQADAIAMDTGSGGIELSGVNASTVALDTGSGSVRLALLSDIEDLSIDTGSGDVTIFVPPSFGAELEAETGSGGIDTEVPIRLRRHSRDSLRGTLGDGRGRMVVETGSGSIRLASSEGR